jgi:hypothetical protein
LPEVEGDKQPKAKFKSYPLGYFHIDLHLFVAIPPSLPSPNSWRRQTASRPQPSWSA